MKSISCRGTTEHKAPKVNEFGVFQEKTEVTQISGEGDEAGKREAGCKIYKS